MFYRQLLILIFYFPIEVMAVTWLQNQEQQGQAAFEQGHYEQAAQLFTDSYRQGIAWYRDKKYAEAAKAFANVTRLEVKTDALYNLGNAYFQQQAYPQAITSYEQALSLRPDFEDARYNLELAKKQLIAPQNTDSQQNSIHSPESSQTQKSDQKDRSGSPDNNPSLQEKNKNNQGFDEENAELTKPSSENQSDSMKLPEQHKPGQANDSSKNQAKSAVEKSLEESAQLQENQSKMGQQQHQVGVTDHASPAEFSRSFPVEKDKMVDAI